MSRLIAIKELSESAATRPRGHEAYDNLLDHLKSVGLIRIDLRGQEPISGSFLDEIVINLQSSRLLDRVAFIVANEAVYKRLAQIALIRNANILYSCSDHDELRPVQTRPRPEVELKVRRHG
jgi:hypothetical protein